MANGSIAAMRKALDKIHLIATTNINECVGDESDIHIVNLANAARAATPRNCDRFVDELDAQLAFLNEEWLISVDRATMLEKDKFENWTDEMRSAYARWLMAEAKERPD